LRGGARLPAGRIIPRARDLRVALRALARRPVFAAAAIAVLAVGIGASSATFSFVDGVLLKAMPIRDPGRVMMLWETHPRSPDADVEVSYPNFLDWRARSRSFSEIAALLSVDFDATLTGRGEPRQVEGTAVSDRFFHLLGSAPRLGRTFLAGEDRPQARPVVVVSERFWRRHLGASPSALGATVVLDKQPATVIGVMPGDFDFPRGADFWIPLSPQGLESRSFRMLRAIGRLRRGTSRAEGAREMASIAATLAREHPKENRDYGAKLVSFSDAYFGGSARTLPLLLLAVSLVVGIACANVAGLLLARVAERGREIAIRRALGATALDVARTVLAETVILSAGGLAAGLGIGTLLIAALRRAAPPDLPRISEVGWNPAVFAFAAAVAIATAVLCAIGPAGAAVGRREGLAGTGARATAARRTSRGRRRLVVAELAAGTALLSGTFLVVRSMRKAEAVDPGYRLERIYSARVSLNSPAYADPVVQARLYTRLVERLRQTPGVESAAAVLMRPLSGEIGWDYRFRIEGQSAEAAVANPYSNFEAVSPGYFQTLGIGLRAGRDFSDADRSDTAGVAIVNRSFAARFWPNQDPVGRRLQILGTPGKDNWLTVVGVAADAHYREWGKVRWDLYAPLLQRPEGRSDFVVRSRLSPPEMGKAFRRALWGLDGDLSVAGETTLRELVDRELALPRFHALLFSIFGAIGILLGLAGIGGLLAHGIAQRRREIGTRIAVGARPSDILRQFVGEAARLAVTGVLLGAAAAAGAAPLLRAFAFGVAPYDVVSVAGAPLVLALAALGTSFFPAWRAARTNPARALRSE